MPKPISIVETSPQQEQSQMLSPARLITAETTVSTSQIFSTPKMFELNNRSPVSSPKPKVQLQCQSSSGRDRDKPSASPIDGPETLHDADCTMKARDTVVASAANNDQKLTNDPASLPKKLMLQSIDEWKVIETPDIPSDNASLNSPQNEPGNMQINNETDASIIAMVEDEITNTHDALDALSPRRRAISKSASEAIVSQHVNRSPGPRKLSNFLDRLQKQTQRKLDSDEKSTTPEFLKMFNKIGSKNKNESIVETSGSAPARDATRTSFEQLRLQGMNQGARRQTELASQPTTKKWIPRKSQNTDDSDSDDSFAKQFMSGAQIAKPTQTQPPPQSSSTVQENDSSDSDDSFARSFMKNAQVDRKSVV